MLLLPLVPADCRLLREQPELLARFNQLGTLLNQLLQYPQLRDRPDVSKVTAEVVKFRERLARPRYLVGFLGVNQSGKSTTVLNLLQAQPGNEPVKEGGGVATTSTVTRIVVVPLGSTPKATIRYLTPEQLESRRRKLCDAVKLDHEDSDEELLTQLKRLQESLNQMPTGDEAPKGHILPGDPLDLIDLLRSRQKHGSYLQNPPRAEQVPYHERDKFINHPPKLEDRHIPSPRHLISEVELEYPTDRVPEAVELVDLPGLGAGRSLDSIITSEFMGQLDGALFFVNATRMEDKTLEEIVADLRFHFQGRAGRAWMVVTRMDGLSPKILYGDPATNTVTLYSGMKQTFLSKGVFRTAQICLVSNHAQFKNAGDAGLPFETSAMLLNLNRDTPIPVDIEADADLKSAFQALIRNGGMGRLRQIVQEQLEKSVALEMRETADQNIIKYTQRLTQAVEHQRQISGGNIDLLLQAQGCMNEVEQQTHDVEHSVNGFNTEVDAIRADLFRHFETLFPNNKLNNELPASQLPGRFRTHVMVLQQKFDSLFQSLMLPVGYDQIEAHLNNPAFQSIPMGSFIGPTSQWDAFRREDCGVDATWKRQLPRFEPVDPKDSLFPDNGNPQTKTTSADLSMLRGSDYRELMSEKIQMVTLRAAYLYRNQLLIRLRAIIDQLRQLTEVDNPTAWTGSGPTIDYDGLLSELRTLCPLT